MALLNYTTKVAAHRSADLIRKALVKAGARSIAERYDPQGRLAGLAFELVRSGDSLRFELPVRVHAVQDKLRDDAVERRFQTFEHAHMVAWRIVHSWVVSQLAIIETGMVEPEQIFLPFLITAQGGTVYDQFQISRQLPAGSSPAE